MNLKRINFKVAVPLAVIAFSLFTFQRLAIPEDAPDTIYYGFPFAYAAPGWHTSMSLQIFVLEFFADLLIYSFVMLFVVAVVNRFVKKIENSKIFTASIWILWSCSFLILIAWIIIASNKNNIFYLTRPYDIEIVKSNWKFFFQ